MPITSAHTKHVQVRPGLGGAGSFRQEPYPVAASQTIAKGDVVSLSSGAVQQAIALPGSNNTGTASGGNLAVLGIAMGSITTDANGVEAGTNRTTLEVAVFDENLEFAMRGYNGTATDAEQRDFAVGTAYQFQRWRGANATTWWYELITTTTNGEFEIVARHPGNALTDAYGVNWCRCVNAAKQIGA